jgi:hypothetical protein
MDLPAGRRFDSRDANSCRQLIAELPLTNVGVAHDGLRNLLTAMHRAPPPATEYFSVLELTREPMAFLQEAMGAHYASRPLPATADETSAFERTVGLWRLMADSYARVAQLGTDPVIQKQLAVVCQRCLHYAGQSLIEYYRARRVIAAGLWMELHGYFDTADDWGLIDQPVIEPLGVDTNTTTCAATYASVLLVDLANPYSRTPRELSWILRWAGLLAPATAVRLPDEDAGARGYGIDLMQDRGLRPVEHMSATPSARLLDTSQLGKKVQQLLARLKEGQSPASMGLGDDCPRTLASRLLLQLYRPWCLVAMPRRFERTRAHGTLSMVYGLDAIYYQVVGSEFVQPAHVRTYSRAEMDTIWTFRNQVDPLQPLSLRGTQLGYTPEPWAIADESLTGFRIFREPAGARVEHGQMVALKPPGKDLFLLARISWLILEKDGRLQAGIQVLPGPPQGVAVRPTGAGVSPSEKYSIGFFLPAVPSLKEPISVILPPGWFNPSRIIEVFTDRQVSVKLGDLLGRGPNFERCSFTLA